MNTIYDQLIIEERILQEQVDLLKERKSNYPEGILEISYSHGHVQYYRRDCSSDRNRARRVYIRKNDKSIAGMFAQRDYDLKLLGELQERLTAVSKARTAYEQTSPEGIIRSFTKERQDLIIPLIPSDIQFIRDWQSQEYKGKPFAEDSPQIFTARGERVRSKSEKIIADTLERKGIPYKYEAMMTLKDGITVYPDFRVLNVRKRKEFIWEHLGMMDDENYASRAVNKLNIYFTSGFFPGEQLIFTMESLKSPLGTKIIEMIIERYLF